MATRTTKSNGPRMRKSVPPPPPLPNSSFNSGIIQGEVKMDGFANIATGLGVYGRDKRMGTRAFYHREMIERVVEELYATSGIAKRIVNVLPDDGTREWIQFSKDDPIIQEEIDRLQIRARVKQAWKWARLYGGSGIFLNTGFTDPRELALPLDLNKINKIISLHVFNRWELYTYYTDLERDLNQPGFGTPKFYHLQPRTVPSTAMLAKIHHSRIIRFDGEELPRLMAISNQYWADSVLACLKEPLYDTAAAFGSMANILQDFFMRVHKMDNIAGLSATPKGRDEIKQRMMLNDWSRAVTNSFLIDRTKEEIELKGVPLTNVKELLEMMLKWLSVQTNIPHTILLNESPSGLGATGNTEIRQWYDQVHNEQETYLSPKLDRIFEAMYAAKNGPTGGKIPGANNDHGSKETANDMPQHQGSKKYRRRFAYEYKKLWQQDPKEEAETNLANAQADQIYIENQVVDNQFIQEKRFPEFNSELPTRNLEDEGQTSSVLGEKIKGPQSEND